MSKGRGRPSRRGSQPISKPKTARQRDKPRRRKLVWLGTLGTAVIAVLVGVLVNVLSTQAQRVVTSSSTVPQLEIDGVTLTSSTTQSIVNSIDVNFVPYKIDIKLLNTGSGVAVINDAKLVIQEYAALPLCESQGFLGSSHTYNGNLPLEPKVGQVVNIPLSEEVSSNSADRFDLALSASLPRGGVSKVYLYRVHVYLTYNVNVRPLDVGEILIDLPQLPDAGEYYWDKYYSVHPQAILGAVYGPGIPAYKKCAMGNSRALHSILSLPGMRPAKLAAILPQLSY